MMTEAQLWPPAFTCCPGPLISSHSRSSCSELCHHQAPGCAFLGFHLHELTQMMPAPLSPSVCPEQMMHALSPTWGGISSPLLYQGWCCPILHKPQRNSEGLMATG